MKDYQFHCIMGMLFMLVAKADITNVFDAISNLISSIVAIVFMIVGVAEWVRDNKKQI